MTTAILTGLTATITQHMADPDSGLSAMDRIAIASLDRRVADMPEAEGLAAIAAFLRPLSERHLSMDLKQSLAALAANVPDAPSFGIDSKADAIAGNRAIIRGRFASEGMALPDADPDTEEGEAEPEDSWQEMSFGEPEESTVPVGKAISNLIMSGIIAAAARAPQGYQIKDLIADLRACENAAEPVPALALALDRHQRFLAQIVPIMAADSGFDKAITESGLPEPVQETVRTSLQTARTSLSKGASVLAVVLAIIIETLPE